VGSHAHKRVVGDFNRVTGESSAIRINAMVTDANNNGSGSSINKRGLSAAFRTGIGEQDEFIASLYHLDNNNGINYGLPFVTPYTDAPATVRSLMNKDPSTSYALDSDYNHSSGTIATLGHTHRFSSDSELKTQFRVGSFKRDMRASTIRFAGAASQPGGAAVTSQTLSDATVLNRNTQLKVQDMRVVQLQSDYSGKFEAAGMKHHLLGGVDVTREEKTVYAARNAAAGGVDISKPTTTVGTPFDGASVNEASRVFRTNNAYVAQGWGAYLQDTVEVAPHWKLVGGLRFDHLTGDYDTYGLSTTTPTAPEFVNGSYRMKVSELSKRVGALYQPNELQSFHFSAGTSFNTSGDAYSLGSTNKDTPPEQSINLELGAKLNSADRRFATRLAVFRSTKLNERNTDPDLPIVTLSGRRHVAGFEIDVTGKITPQWEVYGSYMWLPIAKVDAAAPCPPAPAACTQSVVGERVGDRPALTPKHSGTVWSTYQLDQQWRVGGGINFRGKQRPTRSEFHVAGYATVDLMAEYKANEQLTVKANLSNVANKLYADQLYPAHYIAGAGRQLQVTGSWKF
jgi:catecholate siderophore receptor